MFNWFMRLFREKKNFVCGGEQSIEINDKTTGAKSIIRYRQPTGDEMLNYVHAQLEDDKTELSDIVKSKEVTSLKLHESIRRKKFIPHAKKIISGFSGYTDKAGNEIKDISYIEKYFPHHLELVCSVAYQANETYKKKD